MFGPPPFLLAALCVMLAYLRLRKGQGYPGDMPTQNAKKLGRLLEKHRKALGLSQEKLGAKVGLPASTILRLERGEFKAPSPEKLQRLAVALEVDFEDLFALAGYGTPEGLPGLPIYLRQKFDDLSDDGVARVERYVERLRKEEEQGGPSGKSRR